MLLNVPKPSRVNSSESFQTAEKVMYGLDEDAFKRNNVVFDPNAADATSFTSNAGKSTTR